MAGVNPTDEPELSLAERRVIALERIAGLLDELVEETAGGFAVLADALEDLREQRHED